MKFKISAPNKGKAQRKPFARIERDDHGGHKVTTGYEHTPAMMMGDHGYEAPKEKVFEKDHGHLAFAHMADHYGQPYDVEQEEAGNPNGGSGLNMNPAIDAAGYGHDGTLRLDHR